MLRLNIYIVLIIAACNSLFADLMTPETLVSLKKIGDLKVSPDSRGFVFTLTTPLVNDNKSNGNIYYYSFTTGQVKQLTSSGNHNSAPVWSPKSDRIAFISDRDGVPQAYLLDMAGGEATKLTNLPEGVSNLGWSPDGKYISFTSEVKLDKTVKESYPDLPSVNARIYDHLPVRHWDQWMDEKYEHLFIIPVTGGDPIDLMPGEKFDAPDKPFGGADDIAWSPDGSEIAYACKKVDKYATSTNTDIYIVSINSRNVLNITKGMDGYDKHPIYSPDGKWIAFQSQERAGYESDRVRLMLFDRTNLNTAELSKGLDQWVEGSCWNSSSNEIFCNAGNNDGTIQIWGINLQGKQRLITSGEFNYGDRFLEPVLKDNSLIVSRRNYNHPEEICILDTKQGAVKSLYDPNREVFDKINPAKIEAKWIKSTDGQLVHCWVVYPPNFDKSRKYPLITYCQGGPQQPVSQHFSYGWSFLTMASKGYVVLAPNRRGCPGFGQDWVDAINRDYGGMAMQDIISATRELAREPYIDNNRIAAVGGSAGGYATFWLEGNNPGLFKAFISHCGMFDMVSKYGSTEELWFPNWDNGGPYWDSRFKSFYEKHSPHQYVSNWSTPILIITGEKDFRVPYTQSLEAFTAAQERNVPSRLLVFPEENHWVLHPQEQILWYKEFFGFLEKYMK